MGFKLVRLDRPEPAKIPLSDGAQIIGRGSFPNCDDHRISRNHAQIVVEDETVLLNSLHQNPCFYRKPYEGEKSMLPEGEWVTLQSGDHFSLLPDKNWYELIYFDDNNTKDFTSSPEVRRSPLDRYRDNRLIKPHKKTIVCDYIESMRAYCYNNMVSEMTPPKLRGTEDDDSNSSTLNLNGIEDDDQLVEFTPYLGYQSVFTGPRCCNNHTQSEADLKQTMPYLKFTSVQPINSDLPRNAGRPEAEQTERDVQTSTVKRSHSPDPIPDTKKAKTQTESSDGASINPATEEAPNGEEIQTGMPNNKIGSDHSNNMDTEHDSITTESCMGLKDVEIESQDPLDKTTEPQDIETDNKGAPNPNNLKNEEGTEPQDPIDEVTKLGTEFQDSITEGTTPQGPINEGANQHVPIDEGTKLQDHLDVGTNQGTELPGTMDEGTHQEGPIDEGTKLQDPIDGGTTTQSPMNEDTNQKGPIDEAKELQGSINGVATPQGPTDEVTNQQEGPIDEGTKLQDPIDGGTTTQGPMDEDTNQKGPIDEAKELKGSIDGVATPQLPIDEVTNQQEEPTVEGTKPQDTLDADVKPDPDNVKKEPESPKDVKDVKKVPDADKPGSSDDQPGAAADVGSPQPPARERCIYGASCYRKNPQHKIQFSHPGESDYGTGARGVCPYGARCRRRDPRHWAAHAHPLDAAPPPDPALPQGPANKRQRKASEASGSEDSEQDSPMPADLIVHGKRVRKAIKRESYSDSGEEAQDPYATDDDSDEWEPPNDGALPQSQDF